MSLKLSTIFKNIFSIFVTVPPVRCQLVKVHTSQLLATGGMQESADSWPSLPPSLHSTSTFVTLESSVFTTQTPHSTKLHLGPGDELFVFTEEGTQYLGKQRLIYFKQLFHIQAFLFERFGDRKSKITTTTNSENNIYIYMFSSYSGNLRRNLFD